MAMSRFLPVVSVPLCLFAVVLSITAVATHPTPALAGCPTTTPAQNEALVRRFVDTWSGANLDLLDTIVDPEQVYHRSVGPGPHTADAVKEYIAGWLVAFPDLRATIHDIYHADGVVIARWSARGTFLGPLQGTPPNGRTAEWTGISIHRVECGRIVDIWTELDRAGLFRQLGIG